MLTSNLPFSKWEQIFKDPMTTAAAIDRLVHHSVILELNIARLRVFRGFLPPDVPSQWLPDGKNKGPQDVILIAV